MNTPQQVEKHFREVFFGGNWTDSNLKDSLADVSWREAATRVYSCNTIAILVYHIGYYVSAVLKVLHGEALNSKDTESFNCPPLSSEEDWRKMQNKLFEEAEAFARLVGQLPESRLWEDFTDKKYGIYYRNIHGIIEHTHYHLGQIAILKKIIRGKER